MKLDKDLQELSKGTTNQYASERERAQGSAQTWLIQEIRNLTKTIKNLDRQNSKLNKAILALTIATVVFAVVQIVIQLW